MVEESEVGSFLKNRCEPHSLCIEFIKIGKFSGQVGKKRKRKRKERLPFKANRRSLGKTGGEVPGYSNPR
jgi:hypothetical protein